MRGWSFLLLLSLSLPSARAAAGSWPADWRAAGFTDVAVTKLSVSGLYAALPPFEAKGALDVHFLLLRGSGWTPADVEQLLSQVTRVYSQCGLRFGAADVAFASAPEGRSRFYKYRPGDPASLEALARAVPLQERPLYYLVGPWLDSAQDDSFSRADWEEAPAPGETREPALFDSVFLPSGIEADAYRREHSAYSTAAHELWHVLTRSAEHYDETPHHLGNIWLDRTDLITARDCKLILANPLVRRP